MERGYIKLWRKTLDSGLLQHPTAWQVFGFLLMSATRTERKLMVAGQVFELKPGDYATSVASLCDALKLSARQCRTALGVLERLEIVTIKTTNKGSLISIVNWHRYQDECQTSDKQTAIKRQAPDKPIEQEVKNNIKNTSYSLSESPDSDGCPPCPHGKILELYAEVLPHHKQVRTWRTAHQSSLKARWREKWKEGLFVDEESGMAYFKRLFDYVKRNKVLDGRMPSRDGREPWQADLKWIIKAANFDKIMERTYDKYLDDVHP